MGIPGTDLSSPGCLPEVKPRNLWEFLFNSIHDAVDFSERLEVLQQIRYRNHLQAR
jgi:hypothetical protein